MTKWRLQRKALDEPRKLTLAQIAKVALGMRLEELERPKAKARVRAAQNNPSAEKFTQQAGKSKGRTRDLVGATKFSERPTLEEAILDEATTDLSAWRRVVDRPALGSKRSRAFFNRDRGGDGNDG